MQVTRFEDSDREELLRGFVELASDTDVANRDSRAFHRASGFREVAQTVNFVVGTGLSDSSRQQP